VRKVAFPLALLAALAVLLSPIGFAANHREAPITSLDHKADITDVYAFASYGGATAGTHVTIIAGVDPFLEPANGPNWFPFDPDILYAIRVDNDNDAVEDIVFEFRFTTEQRLPSLFTAYAGFPGGVVAPPNSPAPVPPGTPIVPDRIDSFDSPGLGQRQRYQFTMVNADTGLRTELTSPAGPLYAVPANVGPRTMDYEALYNAGIHTTTNGIKVFAGTTDDAFWIDLGGTFDTLNTHVPPILTPAQDAANANAGPDMMSGYAVNSIAIEVPITMLTRTGAIEPASSPAATIGVWATTSRPQIKIRRPPLADVNFGNFVQVQRMGNPLINELLIGTGSKDRFSMDQPRNDVQFAGFLLDPPLARVVNAISGGLVAIPASPRIDLAPLIVYAPPIAAPGTPFGPVADLLRLNTGVPPAAPGTASRLGLLGGDPAGYPNGRRVFDDVTDIALRIVAGGVLAPPFPGFTPGVNDRLGDGVNVNDAPYLTTFPYLAHAPSGRDRRHINPGDEGDPPTLTFTGLGTNPAVVPAGAAAWRVRNPDIGHIDGPFALPGAENPLALPVAAPCLPGGPSGCLTTGRGGSWAGTDVCVFIHLHGPFEGHDDPAPGPPATTSACGHGAFEIGFFQQ
jgi:hypothetical protein